MAAQAESYYTASGGVIAAGSALSAATGVFLTDTAYQRVYQRVGGSKAITVAGTYTGPAQVLHARAAPSGTALSALSSEYPWMVVSAFPTGGVFSGALNVPQGDGYVVQVRDGVNTSIGDSGTHVFGVGVIIAMIGQSNMQNMFSSIYGYPLGSQSSYLHRDGAFSRLGNVSDGFPPGSLSAVYGGSYTSEAGAQFGNGLVLMANELVSSLGVPIVMLTYAQSGSSIIHWQPGQTYLNLLLSDVDTIGGDFEFAIWLQGETDAAGAMSAAAYQANLQALFDACKAHTGRASADFNFGVVVVGPVTDAWAGAAERTGPIRAGQIDFVTANAANGAFLCGSATDGNLAGASTAHINQQSLFRQGARYTEAVKRRLSASPYNIEGPKISSATLSGAVVTVNITHNGGTSLMDGAGGSGASLLGFRVFDGGVQATISSTAISGSAVILTLSAAPSGAVTLDYGMANAPYGATTSPASVCYDNQTIGGSRTPYSADLFGLPLQPKHLITVT